MENDNGHIFDLRKSGETLQLIALSLQNYCDETETEAAKKSSCIERWEKSLFKRESALDHREIALNKREAELKTEMSKFKQQKLDLEKRESEMREIEIIKNRAFEQREIEFNKRETDMGELEATRSMKAQRKEAHLRDLQAKLDKKEELLNVGRDILNKDIKKAYAKVQVDQADSKLQMKVFRQQFLQKLMHQLDDFKLDSFGADFDSEEWIRGHPSLLGSEKSLPTV